SAWATVSPATGQPGAPTNTCGPDNPVTPGSSATANGSPFNGSGQAGAVYAGNPGTASLANANSTAAVSQYDVACVQLSHCPYQAAKSKVCGRPGRAGRDRLGHKHLAGHGRRRCERSLIATSERWQAIVHRPDRPARRTSKAVAVGPHGRPKRLGALGL